MRIGVLGTGMAGQALARKCVKCGHDVMMGSRTADSDPVLAFADDTGGRAGTFAAAAAHGDLVILCVRGDKALAVLRLAGAENLASKTLIDVTNPLDFSTGMPPTLLIANTDSLGETIQREYPDANVVKTLNTVTASIMVAPDRLHGAHAVFVSGNDSGAKAEVEALLREFGWQAIIDLGDITTARGPEMMMPMWLRLWHALGTGEFNYIITKAESRD